MERIRQLLLPGILIGLLLLANLLPLNQEPAVTPTPAPGESEGTSVAYPDLPGRLIFRDGEGLQLLERRAMRSVPLPASFSLPENAGDAFSPNGNWVAGFTRQGEQSYLDVIDLASGVATRLGAAEAGSIRWSQQSERVAVWAADQIRVFGFNQTPMTLVPQAGMTVRQVAWAPDGSQLALVLTTPNDQSSTLGLLELASPATFTPVAKEGLHPFWAPNGEGLIYARQPKGELYANELVLRKPDGQEVVLVNKEQLLQAHPDVASIDGAGPHLLSIQGEFNPASFLFTLKFYSGVNPRFAIGTVSLPGTPVQLYLLPAYPDHPLNEAHNPPRPCNPGGVYPLESSILFVAEGFGCDGAVGRLERGSLELLALQGIGGTGGLISPDGDWVLRQQASRAMPTATAMQGGSSKLIPFYGQPIHWDRG